MPKTVIKNHVAPVAIDIKVIILIALVILALAVAATFVMKENPKTIIPANTASTVPIVLKIWYTEPGAISATDATNNPALTGIEFTANTIKNNNNKMVLATIETGQEFANSALLAPGEGITFSDMPKAIWIAYPNENYIWRGKDNQYFFDFEQQRPAWIRLY